MNITIKTKEEQKAMIEGGKILGKILKETANIVQEGISTKEIDAFAEKMMKELGVVGSFKGYHGFPAVTCISINEEVVHTIPGNRLVKNGDLVKIDCGVLHRGLNTDSAIPILVGEVDPRVKKFVETIEEALYKGIDKAIAGNSIYDISSVIQNTVENNGYSIVRELTGHGIGKELHEDPYIPNFREKKSQRIILKPGMTIAIEPIAVMGRREIQTLEDNWTIVSTDGSIATQSEHTIFITEGKPLVLTERD